MRVGKIVTHEIIRLCLALQELINMGDSIITFDVHDPRVQNHSSK